MKKLNNKGNTLLQVLAASLILSYFLMHVIGNVTSMMANNKNLSRRENAFYHAEDVYNHIVNGDTSSFVTDINANDLVIYLPIDCSDENKDLLNVFWDGQPSTKAADITYCTDLMTSTYFEDSYLLLYTHDFDGFDAIVNSNQSTDAMIDYAQGIITNTEYFSSPGIKVYGISLFIYYIDDRVVEYHSIVELEIT